MHQSQEPHLEVVARLIRHPHFLLGAGQQVEGAQQVFARPLAGHRQQAFLLGLRGHVGIRGALGVHRQDQQVARRARQLPAQQPQVVAALDGTLDQRKRRRRVFADHSLEHVEHQVTADEAEHRDDILDGDRITRKRAHLVEGAERVAHAAFTGPRQQQQAGLGDFDLLFAGDLTQLLGHYLRGDRAELVDLRARQHRVWNLVLLGRRHHENDVRRRFFNRFQQRVERRRRQHVDFVDDEDLVAIADRRDRQAFDDHLADVVDAGVRGGVDFQHVDVTAFGNLDTRVAHAARVGRRALRAAERPRQDARGRRLATATRARQHERLGDAFALERVLEGARDRLLPEHILELLRTPLAGENLVGHL